LQLRRLRKKGCVVREYGKVTSAMWADGRLNETARHLLIYLHSGPHTNWIGCFQCAEGYASDDLGLSIPRSRKAFAELVESGWIKRCGKMVFLPGFLAGNQVENGNVATSRFKQFLALPDGEHKAWVAAEMLRDMRHLTEDQRAQLAVFVSKTDAETTARTDAGTVNQIVPATVQLTVGQTVPQTVSGTETVGTVGTVGINTAKAKAKAKAKKIEIKDLKGGVGENFARIDETARTELNLMPAPPAQAPSVFDGWIFADSAPAEPAPAPSVKAESLFDDSLFADTEPVVSPEDAAAVDRLLFGKSPPPQPPAPAWNKPGKAKIDDAVPKTAPALLVQAEPLFDDWPFADDTFALTPEDEAEVAQILFGEMQPSSPCPHPPQPLPAPTEDARHGKFPKRKRSRTLGLRELVAEEANPQHAEDWLCVRKAKHAPLTITAWNEIKQEGEKAGLTPAKVVEMCAARGWRGFKASWLSDTNQSNESFNHSRHTSRRNRLEPIAI